MASDFFSSSYTEARSRFQDLAAKVGASQLSYPVVVDGTEDLTIDLATIGPDDAPAVFVSSGIHGVEGFFGSAVQLGILSRMMSEKPDPRLRYLFLHVLNPYGFSAIRRGNEQNVDLNRNFVIPPNEYRGAGEGYTRLNRFLNPESAPGSLEFFRLLAAWAVLRYGMQQIKQAVAGGQYAYPRGLFYGGAAATQSTRVVIDHCDDWIGRSRRIIHLDLHTGLGQFGEYRLLLLDDESPEAIRWYAKAFGAAAIDTGHSASRTAYRVSGAFGAWMQWHFSTKEYRFAAAEFGTYDSIRMLRALRAENRLYHYGCRDDPRLAERVKAEFHECFCPSSPQWRNQVVEAGIKIFDQAVAACRSV